MSEGKRLITVAVILGLALAGMGYLASLIVRVV